MKREEVGKKGDSGSGRLLVKMCRCKSGHGGFGALDGARRSRGLSKVHPEVRDEKMQQIFQLFDTKEKKNHFVASRRR